MDVPVPQIMEDILEAVEIIPKQHIPERKFVKAFDVPVHQIQEGIVEVSQLLPQALLNKLWTCQCQCL